MGGKGSWDDLLQAWVFYSFSIYYPMDLVKVVGTVSWQDKSCTPFTGLKAADNSMVWLIYNR